MIRPRIGISHQSVMNMKKMERARSLCAMLRSNQRQRN
jgi:hypothetical protein